MVKRLRYGKKEAKTQRHITQEQTPSKAWDSAVARVLEHFESLLTGPNAFTLREFIRCRHKRPRVSVSHYLTSDRKTKNRA